MVDERSRIIKFCLKIVFAHIAAVICLVALTGLCLLAARHCHSWPFAA